MKKVERKNADRRSTLMAKTQTHKPRLLRKLAIASEAARTRVSGYSDDSRSRLEQLARGVIRSVKTTPVCRH